MELVRPKLGQLELCKLTNIQPTMKQFQTEIDKSCVPRQFIRNCVFNTIIPLCWIKILVWPLKIESKIFKGEAKSS